MKLLGKILWVIFFGIHMSLLLALCGIICCVTIVGIPFGRAYFRIAKLMICPFDKEVSLDSGAHPVANVLWLVFGGLELAAAFAFWGIVFCVTIIGIPFGKQFFKLAKLSAFPIGASVG